jgi:uncharacterized protein YciI
VLSVLGLAIAMEPTLFFGFFMRGDGPRPTGPGALDKMQADHIGNLQRLHGLGNLLAAGPLQDPSQQRRGILVLKTGGESEIPGLFTEDPYVKNQIMFVKTEVWNVDPAHFNQKLPDPDGIKEYRLVISPITTDSKRLRDAMIPKSLKIVGGPGKDHQFFLVEGFQPGLEDNVKAADAKAEVIPLWMTPGILK